MDLDRKKVIRKIEKWEYIDGKLEITKVDRDLTVLQIAELLKSSYEDLEVIIFREKLSQVSPKCKIGISDDTVIFNKNVGKEKQYLCGITYRIPAYFIEYVDIRQPSYQLQNEYCPKCGSDLSLTGFEVCKI